MEQYLLNLPKHYYFWGCVGFLIGTTLSVYNITRTGIRFRVAVVMMAAAIWGGLVGSRLLFLIEKDRLHSLADLARVFLVWKGGLSWLAGPPLGALAAAVVLLLARAPVMESLGAAFPGIALSHAVSRIGCLVHGCCYGRPTTLPWAIYSERLQTYVHPTQVYSMLAELIVAATLQVLFRKPPLRKYLFPLYGILLASHRFVTESFRGTSPGPELITGLRFHQSICILVLAVSICGLALLWDRKRGLLISGLVAASTGIFFTVFNPASVSAFVPK